MSWEALATEPLDIDSGVGAPRARAVARALLQVAVPLLVMRDGRAEPLASGALYADGRSLLLLTCRHLFDDGVAVGDLGLPLGDTRRMLWLREARPRVLVDPVSDLAAIRIGCPRGAASLSRHWRTVPMQALAGGAPARVYVLAGFPYAQMRRAQGVLHARPAVIFAQALASDERLRLSYRRIARRADGQDIHAPALDGVSGATLWAITEGGGPSIDCELHPAAVQCAFKHDAYVEAEPLEDFANYLRMRLA